MRDTTLTFRQAINAPQTDELFVILLELDHADLLAPIRVNNSGVTITSNGHDYIYFPFTLDLPSDEADQVPQAKLILDNVSLEQIAAIRSLQTSPSVRIMVVLQSSPDDIEVDFSDFSFSDISYDANTITGTLSINDFMLEPFPGDYFVPSDFPAAF